MTRFRPRFSIRTLVILITLVCCYTACWGPTKRQGVDDVALRTVTKIVERYDTPEDPQDLAHRAKDSGWVTACYPLVVCAEDGSGAPGTSRHYYFWFFGYVAKLPG